MSMSPEVTRLKRARSREHRPKVARVPEKIVQQQIVHLLRSIGAAVYVLGTRRRRGDFHGTMQTPGIPDLFAFLPLQHASDQGLHSVLWVEVKADGGRLRLEQAAFQALCEQHQYPHIVGGVDAVVAWLVRRGFLKDTQVAHYRAATSDHAEGT